MNFELYVIFFPLWENPAWCICSIWRAEPESVHTWCLCCSLLIGLHCFLCSVGTLFNSILMTQNEDLTDAPPHWWRPLVARCDSMNSFCVDLGEILSLFSMNSPLTLNLSMTFLFIYNISWTSPDFTYFK